MPVRSGIECVFFMRLRAPAQPTELVRRICADALACKDIMKRKCKYLNRMTPVTKIDKASEQGIQRVARSELAAWFDLNSPLADPAQQTTAAVEDTSTTPASENLDLNTTSTDRPAYSVSTSSLNINTTLNLAINNLFLIIIYSMPSDRLYEVIQRIIRLK